MFPPPLPTPLISARTWIFDHWSPDIFAFKPAGLYAGNRFPSLCVDCSPRVPEALLRGKDTPDYITTTTVGTKRWACSPPIVIRNRAIPSKPAAAVE